MENDELKNWRHAGNHYGVGSSPDGKQIRIMGLMAVGRQQPNEIKAPIWPLALSRESALQLAAWIVAVSFPKDGEFERILDYVRGKPIA